MLYFIPESTLPPSLHHTFYSWIIVVSHHLTCKNWIDPPIRPVFSLQPLQPTTLISVPLIPAASIAWIIPSDCLSAGVCCAEALRDRPKLWSQFCRYRGLEHDDILLHLLCLGRSRVVGGPGCRILPRTKTWCSFGFGCCCYLFMRTATIPITFPGCWMFFERIIQWSHLAPGRKSWKSASNGKIGPRKSATFFALKSVQCDRIAISLPEIAPLSNGTAIKCDLIALRLPQNAQLHPKFHPP